jgi:hypothetical protein
MFSHIFSIFFYCFPSFPAAWLWNLEATNEAEPVLQELLNVWSSVVKKGVQYGINMDEQYEDGGIILPNGMNWTGDTTPTILDFNYHVWYGLASNNTILNHWGRYAKNYGMWNSLSWGSFLIATAVRGFIGCVQVTGAGQWSIFAIL